MLNLPVIIFPDVINKVVPSLFPLLIDFELSDKVQVV